MSPAPSDKAIVLGIDGLSPSILEGLMEAGQAPNFSKLRDTGAYRRLNTTNPSQSPVVWSTIAAGSNPGYHGVFDFLRRDPRSYLPELAILRVNPRNVLGRRRSMFLPVRKGNSFWSVTSEAGVPTSVIRWPLTLPPDEVNGRMLAGLGVPDLNANLGRYVLYSTRALSPEETAKRKGDVLQIPTGRDVFDADIPGPERAKIPAKFSIDREAAAVTLTIDGKEHVVKEKAWSDWIHLTFTFRLRQPIHGVCRAYLRSLAPGLELYLSPIQADPSKPAFIISHPDEYAQDLANEIGTYHTLGMPEDTNALQDKCFDGDAFLDLCDCVMAEREKMLWLEIDRLDSGLLAFVFDTTDRVQHAFWAAEDTEHPLHDEAFARRYGSVIKDYYRRMDGIVGKVIDAIGDTAGLIVLSDHGFSTFRRAVHVNSWLADNGLMTLKDEADRDTPLFRNVDWGRTTAYALGFTSIYLNLKGREGKGIVAAGDEAAAAKREIAEKLRQFRDPAADRPVFKDVYDCDDLYTGPCADDSPDLVVGYEPGYRTSWQTAIGGSPKGLIEDNRESWSGDHLIDPSYVPGVFFMNRQTTAADALVMDVAPTVLDMIGLPKHAEMEGNALTGR